MSFPARSLYMQKTASLLEYQKKPFNTSDAFLIRCLPSPGSSVGSDAGCQSRGCEFESQLSQHFFRRLTKVTVTCVIRLSPMGCLTVYVEKKAVACKSMMCGVLVWENQETHE